MIPRTSHSCHNFSSTQAQLTLLRVHAPPQLGLSLRRLFIFQTGGSTVSRDSDDSGTDDDTDRASPSRRAPSATATSSSESSSVSLDDKAEWLKMRHTGEHRKARPTRNSASWIKESATSPTSPISPTKRPTPRALHESRPSGASSGFEPEARVQDTRCFHKCPSTESYRQSRLHALWRCGSLAPHAPALAKLCRALPQDLL